MKIKKLSSGNLLLLDSSNNIVRGFSDKIEVSEDLRDEGFILLSGDNQADPYQTVAVPIQELKFIIFNTEIPAPSTSSEVISYFMSNMF